MLSTILVHELRRTFLSLRFQIAFLITFLVFAIGTFSYLKSYRSSMKEYEKYQSEVRGSLQKIAGRNLTELAVKNQDFIFSPRADAFITGSKEQRIPDSITFSAFNVFRFETRSGNTNPYLNPFEELNWEFIVSILLSFTVLLLSHDSISGEKETRTLAVALANPLSRGILLFGKYLAVLVGSLLILLPGMCLSMIILLLSRAVSFSPGVLFEIVGFILASGLFLSCIAAFGLLASVLVKSPDVSLLAALIVWVLFVVIVPNSAIYLSQAIFPIPNSDTIHERVRSAKDALEKNGPEGRWQMIQDQPFYPFHQVRANHQMNLMNAEKEISDEYSREMFAQLEHARALTFISPVSLFDYLSEAIVAGGYLRFRNVWSGLHEYQARFLTFFKEKDAQDRESPHWFNPYENVSTTRKPVNFSEVPVYQERTVPLRERFFYSGAYLTVMALFTVLVFFAAFVLFVRYDVR